MQQRSTSRILALATLALLLTMGLVQSAVSLPGDAPGTSDVRDAMPEPVHPFTEPVMHMVFKRLGEVRTYDGTDNNPERPLWGAVGTQQIRLGPVDYPDDGTGATMYDDDGRPNARMLSNAVFAIGPLDHRDSRSLSDHVWQWGQFLDHDITLTPPNASEIHDIATPFDDIYFQGTPIPFERTQQLDGSGANGVPRQYPNAVSAWVDGSNVYGSDAFRAHALRTHEGGKMKTGDGDLLPFNTMMLENAGGPRPDLFIGGDVRVNEQLGLTSMHTLFVREHNRIADEVALMRMLDPVDDDEEIYQTARKLVIAELQAITYKEFLPALLGPSAPTADAYTYNNSTDPSISLEFSTALYRLGHSMINANIKLADDTGTRGILPLRHAYFRSSYLVDDPARVDYVLKGLATQRMQRVDGVLVDDLRNFLFAQPGQGGLDLAAFNIQRSRDHGLATYNDVRSAYGLTPAVSFSDITSDATMSAALSNAYGGDIEAVEAWVGTLLEDHVPGGSVGPLVEAALVDQFARLRDGDRFFYTADPDLQEMDLKQIVDVDTVRLSDIILTNTDLEHMQENVFFVNG